MLAPEHPLVERFAAASSDPGGVPREGAGVPLAGPRRRAWAAKEGFDTGRQAINPFTGKPVPIWVANFVLWRIRHRRDHGRARPRRARLRVRPEVQPADHASSSSAADAPLSAETMTEAHAGDGSLVNSGAYNGLPWEEANRG